MPIVSLKEEKISKTVWFNSLTSIFSWKKKQKHTENGTKEGKLFCINYKDLKNKVVESILFDSWILQFGGAPLFQFFSAITEDRNFF